MIMTRLQTVVLVAVVSYFIFLLSLLIKRRLNLKYTLLWLAFGLVLLIFALFPSLLNFFASLVGFEVASNGLFAILHFCELVLLISMTAIVSKLNEKEKRLIQTAALLERRIRELEKSADKQQEHKGKEEKSIPKN